MLHDEKEHPDPKMFKRERYIYMTTNLKMGPETLQISFLGLDGGSSYFFLHMFLLQKKMNVDINN